MGDGQNEPKGPPPRDIRLSRGGKTPLPELGVAIALLLLGLQLRLLAFPREFHVDEAFHNLRLLSPATFWDLCRKIAEDSQPTLEYLLRKFLWIPVLGESERALRLPSLFYSLATITAAIALAHRYFRRHAGNRSLCLLATAVAGAWCACHPMEILQAGGARNYAFIALASLLWCYWFALADRSRKSWTPLFLALTFVFLNAHFFTMPLVALASLEAISDRWYRTNSRQTAAFTAGLAAVGLSFLILNHVPIQNHFAFLPERLPLLAPIPELFNRLTGAMSLSQNAWVYLNLPLMPALLWLAVWAMRNPAAWRPARYAWRADPTLLRWSILFLGHLATLGIISMGSSHAFAPRYFTPFFGLGFVTLLLGLRAIFLAPMRAGNLRLGALALVTLLAFEVRPQASHLDRIAAWPAENFSVQYQFFSGVKGEGKPAFFVAYPCYISPMGEIYWNHIVKAGPAGLPMIQPRNFYYWPCSDRPDSTDPRPLRDDISRFVSELHGSRAILYKLGPPCPTRPLTGLPSTMQLRHFEVPASSGTICITVVDGIRRYEDFERAAKLTSLYRAY